MIEAQHYIGRIVRRSDTQPFTMAYMVGDHQQLEDQTELIRWGGEDLSNFRIDATLALTLPMDMTMMCLGQVQGFLLLRAEGKLLIAHHSHFEECIYD